MERIVSTPFNDYVSTLHLSRAINDSPIGKFSDILYVQGVLDALRRSDKSGEVENVEMGNELKLEQLHFQAEFGTYVETVDHLQI